jgi:maltooligosyltrehalose trehalohydrolase
MAVSGAQMENETGTARSVALPFGAELTEGGVRFRVFAPAAQTLKLKLEDRREPLEMHRSEAGWFELTTDQAQAGTRYRYVLPDGTAVADPVSRFQPEDLSGPSEVIDPGAYRWTDAAWRGRPWEEVVLYELHVGTFTEEGTFLAAIEKLDSLRELGVTAIELMCVADFAGLFNWGYDGAMLYAPDSTYGRPEDLKAFVDAAHARGLMVIFDVVYNHFGPEGNVLPKLFPRVLTEQDCTPWGPCLNFDGEQSEQVRSLILENAVFWVEEYHADGLRLDASHAMIDHSPKHILEEMSARLRARAREENRHIHLVLENETNIAQRLLRTPEGASHGFTAQWNHDITHLLAAAFAPGCEEGEEDRGETEKLAKALAEGFVILAQEEGLKEEHCVPPTSFIAFIQTHDLVGNRVFGERLVRLVPHDALRAITAVYLLLPQIPMLFMGEEWGASTPFPYFSDFHGSLADAVRKGRCESLSKLDPKPSEEELRRAPDPQSPETFRSAKLLWHERSEVEHAPWVDLYASLLRVRREVVTPLLGGLTKACGCYRVLRPGALEIEWSFAGGAKLCLQANLCAAETAGFAMRGKDRWVTGWVREDGTMGPWSVRWGLDATT